ncbi:uncharacterized protein LOC122318507 [Carya illinoinensis]|uniref:AAA+ ATPase domain-containing protein n=1 Tax=Carya illinoinensis TaxID=32201 RepID=A0A8T1PNY9_CARIL|nr:uncharacterized protein LOC122318507 [Carya illinoinensis]XP_042991857.1 uncharacterized protein LOC122318507 [Carya illinoinensis]XP_042991858.1 uncharacterized protein LOC122318507 [Carya illinoinensis]XP_042991859.1 uncharacterized protein LOC122318507 [Carya illinoinensis]XP_042991861.1 uncharacterized protein LOC122318507 [Carya illinoinensis]XP_042991862.1 uncharacterized protein LOC122318507 [Carya illinoinensis]KAG6646169.1 hypothetical protein CIPAW_08G175100 [Carya illinoinensis]
MAENIVISIAAKIAEYTVAPVGQWLCYSCHYNSNIENLKKQKEKLQYARERVQDSVDAAKRNGEKIYTDVTNWLTDVDRITEWATTKLREIEEEAGTGSFNASCLNLKHRHQLSREAKKIVEAIAELHNNGNFKEVSKPALPLEEMDYNRNMENLKNQKEKLQHARERVQDSVDAALINGEKIYPDVSKWLKDVDGLTELATRKLSEIEEEAGTGSSNAACLNSEHRHQLSREAKQMVRVIDELLKNGNFNGVSGRPALQEMVTPRNMDYMVMNSRMAVVKDIMEALRSADIYTIGVWGMPGVGKSTLMKEIARQAREEGIFNKVVVVEVTNNPVIRQIQGAIASTLGLNFDQETDEQKARQIQRAIASTLGLNFDHETNEQKASLLQQRLSKDKKILVILDNIWKELGLQEIGITSEGIKVVMTSRNRDVLSCGMGIQKEIELKTLQNKDALKLFEMRAGEILRDPKVSGIATKIVEKCAGLPIALVTVSKALKNKNLSEWKDALRRLKRPAPEHLTEMLKTIYSPIEWSYDSLESQELKSLFLLCAQLPYFLDYRDLLKYSYGYGLSHGIYTLEEARATLDTLLRKLKDSCLLLESSNGFCMHDLVRDVATIIASKNHNMFVMRDDGGQKAWQNVDALNRCEALSIHGGDHIHNHPNKMECPKLRFFYVQCENTSFQGMDKVEDIFFQGMEKLEVLSLRSMRLSSLFPLTNLQTLCLDRCMLGDIHGIGELKTLVILSLAHSNISNLPREIGLLTRLRLLDLTYCFQLKVIPPNVLSSLVNLEELYMQKINVQWEVEGPSNEGKNASLAELKKLTHLTSLEIDILDVNNLPKDLVSEKLERYKISIGAKYYDNNKHIPELRTSAFENLKVLNVENCEKLRFIFSLSIAKGFSLLEELKITGCNNVVGAIFVKEEEDGIEDQGDMMLFDRLQTLVLKNLPKLVGFLITKDSFMTDCRETNSEGNHDLQLPLLHHDKVSVPSLQTLRMEGLPKIKHVWSCGQEPKTVFTCLEQLQVLEIEDCGVEEIVAVEKGGGEAVAIRTLVFPQVTKLSFRTLRRLKWFYKGVHVSKWPKLKEMKIERCKKVEIFASEIVSFGKTGEDQRQSEMFIKQPLFSVDEHSFPSLETLRIFEMDSLEIIFGKLEGQNGKEAQVLISPASGTEESGATTHSASTLSFPSLKKLHIRWMRKLEIIWQDQVTATSFPNIQELDIHNCDKLLHVFQSKLHTTTTLIESLTILNISYCSSLETVFGNMEGQNGKELQVLIAPSSGTEDGIAGYIEFPILTQLSLFELPKLKWIFEGVHTNLESWPSLKKLSLVECGEQVNKMIWASKFASSSSSQENQLPTCIQQPMFVVEEGTFPNLEYLSFCFRERTKCPSRFSDFPDPSSLLTGLPNLLNLNVYDSVWEEIFPYELVDREIRLRILRLCRLCMLTHLWKEDNTQPCPLFHNLEYLHVLRCGKLRNIVPSSVSLRNLTRLEISDCHGLINLLTSSTAKTLVQLERMTVIDCKRITEIVAMEDGEANVAITFNKLRCLELRGLPNLTHFCSGHYSFGFPSLDEVIVRCCPEMKTFSHGVLSTPKLKGVSDDYSWFSKRNLYWEDDLNTTTRCLWEESNQYDTRLLFRERVENSEEDEDHPSEDEDHSETTEEW